MKKRIFAGILLTFMLIFAAIPCFAEPVAETEATAATEAAAEGEAAPAAEGEEAPAEEAPADAAPVEEAPALPEYKATDVFTLKEAVYDSTASNITITVANKSDIQQGILYFVLDFDTTKISVTPDMQTMYDSSIAPQAGVEMEDGALILIQKLIDAGAEQTVKFDASIVDYTEGSLPEIGLRVFAQSISPVIDLTSTGSATENEITVQKFDNIFVTAENGSAISTAINFVKENILLVLALLIIILLVIIIIIMSSKKNGVNSEEQLESEEDAEFETASEYNMEDDFEVDSDVTEDETDDEENGGFDNEEI